MARRRRSGQADRLEAGAGTLHNRRQSLQRLAGGRQRAGAGRGRRQGIGRRAGRQAHDSPWRAVPTGPGKTSLAKGEIIEAILLDRRPPRSGDAYLRFIPRTEMDIAVVSAGVSLTLDEEGVVKAARVALGAVAPTVLLVEEAAEALIGTKLDEAALERLAKACSAACRPIDDKRGTVEFRRKVAGVLAKRAATTAYARAGGKVMSGVAVSTTINGDDVEYLCQPDETLLDVLRDRLGLTGAKEGCGTGDCGACSIILDDRLVCSCLVLGAEAEGRRVETIEGMAHGDKLHPLQQKFLEHAALQCGICTPGFLMAAKDLLARNPDPTEEEIRFGLAGNLCRCTGFHAPHDGVDRPEAADSLQEHGLVAHRQVGALDEREAEIAREIGVLERAFPL